MPLSLRRREASREGQSGKEEEDRECGGRERAQKGSKRRQGGRGESVCQRQPSGTGGFAL